MNGFSLRRMNVVLSKEIRDNLRDRRSLSSSLLTPVFMPIFLIAMIMILGRTLFNPGDESALNVPVQGAEYAPGLIEYLRGQNIVIEAAPADPRAAVREGDLDMVLIIGADYGEALTAGQPAPLELVMDTSRSAALRNVARLRNHLNGYANTVAFLRLAARGVDPQLVQPLDMTATDVATPESQSLIFLNMMPFMLIMTIFVGGMYVVIDATAGERERGSLEPLLINPVRRSEFVMGKLIASLPFALAALGLALILFWMGFNLIPLEEYVGMKMSISAGVMGMIFLLCLPVVLLSSALQMIVAAFTRSFKEAQTYLSFLPLVAGLPGAFLAFLPVKPTLVTMLIPTFGQSILINQFLRGETVLLKHILWASGATLAVSLILCLISIRLYQREQILFSKGS